jgi:sugar/nucleoside kinase (ribokinase family)
MDITPISLALQFANAAGALSTTKRGAIPALPTLEEIRGLMEAQACV